MLHDNEKNISCLIIGDQVRKKNVETRRIVWGQHTRLIFKYIILKVEARYDNGQLNIRVN